MMPPCAAYRTPEMNLRQHLASTPLRSSRRSVQTHQQTFPAKGSATISSVLIVDIALPAIETVGWILRIALAIALTLAFVWSHTAAVWHALHHSPRPAIHTPSARVA
jgi:hypothetical protein